MNTTCALPTFLTSSILFNLELIWCCQLPNDADGYKYIEKYLVVMWRVVVLYTSDTIFPLLAGYALALTFDSSEVLLAINSTEYYHSTVYLQGPFTNMVWL